MLVSVFGASSRLGQVFIDQAAAQGHTMRLHYRAKPAEHLPATATVVVGSLSDPAAVREVLRGSEVAVVLFGPTAEARVPYCAAATKGIIASMTALGQSRLLVVTDALTGALPGTVGVLAKLMTRFTKRSAPDGMLEDREEQERAVRGSALAGWTLVKPPGFTDGPGDGPVRIGPAQAIGVGSRISRVALAKALLEEIRAPHFAQQAVYAAEG